MPQFNPCGPRTHFPDRNAEPGLSRTVLGSQVSLSPRTKLLASTALKFVRSQPACLKQVISKTNRRYLPIPPNGQRCDPKIGLVAQQTPPQLLFSTPEPCIRTLLVEPSQPSSQKRPRQPSLKAFGIRVKPPPWARST